MDRKPRGGFASDDGMSIAEVVIASFILFFVLTAIMSLVWTTTQMGVSAKQRSAITNVLSSHVEWVRSLSYDEVALQGSGEASAAIPPQRTLTIEGFTVVVTTTVSEGGPGVKEVQVDAVASGPGYRTLSMSQHASIRDYSTGLTAITTTGGMKVKFGTSTPPADTVVYSAYYGSSSPLYIDAVVDVNSDNPETVITELTFTCSENYLRNGATAYADLAIWYPMTATYSERIRWNTEQVDNEEQPDAIEDGWRFVRINAFDSEGNPSVVVERRFLVDNDPPGVPGSPVSRVMSDTEVRLGWTSAKDGPKDDAWGYGVMIYKVNSTGGLVLQNPIDAEGDPVDFRITPSAFIHSATNPLEAPATAFSRYVASVRALSPRLLASAYVDVLPQEYVVGDTKVYVTRPLLSGESYTAFTGNAKFGTYAATTHVTGSVTPPTFGCSTIRYDLYRGTTTTNLALIKENIGPTFTDDPYKFLGSSTTAPIYYYQYKITYLPQGDTSSGNSEVMWSNISGPTSNTDESPKIVIVPMPQVEW